MERKRYLRDFTYADYGIDKERYEGLKDFCTDQDNADIVLSAFQSIEDYIIPHLYKAVTNNLSYEKIEYDSELGRVPVGRTDFYGYRRYFFHLLNQKKVGTN